MYIPTEAYISTILLAYNPWTPTQCHLRTFYITFLYLHGSICECVCVCTLRICDEQIFSYHTSFQKLSTSPNWPHLESSFPGELQPPTPLTMYLSRFNSQLLPTFATYPLIILIDSVSSAHSMVHAFIIPPMQHYSVLCRLIRVAAISNVACNQKA